MEMFHSRLSSISEIGLNSPKLVNDYVIRYHGALNGKHFKSLMQIMAFAAHGLVKESLQIGWNLLGRAAVLIWSTDIRDVEQHTVRLFSTT